MPDRQALPVELTSSGVVAIARGRTTDRVAAAVEHLVAAGINCVELTLTMPGAIAAIASLIENLGTAACIGAGTVLTADQARACIDAGARFLVAPSVVPEVVAVAYDAKVPCLPGALTPSEIVQAWQSGAAAVKLFPASLGGPRYLRDVRAPMPDIGLIPTGGVGLDDIGEYLSAGAVAVGLGSPLFGSALDDGDFEALSARARRVVAAVSSARAS
ncbi:MAG: bifunctional 4-hydroxy-2-oxoglutarate aldolase/2-dehydro-3-deoxy-phosphogluconate aldolase [Acidothermaceae bacterium]